MYLTDYNFENEVELQFWIQSDSEDQWVYYCYKKL